MVKLRAVEATDSEGVKTVFVIEDERQVLYDEFDTEPEAKEALGPLKAEFDLDDKIKTEYLAWEKGCRERLGITVERLRDYLADDGWWTEN